jgi:cyanate permease
MGATTNRPVLVLAGIIVLSALALRPQIIAIGPLVDAIDTDLGVSHTVTGLLGTIPLLCMGISPGLAAPRPRGLGPGLGRDVVMDQAASPECSSGCEASLNSRNSPVTT